MKNLWNMENKIADFGMFGNTIYHILYTIFMLLAILNVSETQSVLHATLSLTLT